MNPNSGGPRSHSGGFTLIEMVVVVAVLGIALGLGIPALNNMILRSRTEGFAHEVASLLQRARLESIKKNRPAAVAVDPTTKDLVAFLDADGDGAFDPNSGNPPPNVDYQIARLPLPNSLAWKDPGGGVGEASIYGNTTISMGGNDRKAPIFRPDGSIADPGTTTPVAFAFRIADARQNFLEVQVSPPTTGKIEILKWQGATVDADPDWYPTPDPADPKTIPWKWN